MGHVLNKWLRCCTFHCNHQHLKSEGWVANGNGFNSLKATLWMVLTLCYEIFVSHIWIWDQSLDCFSKCKRVRIPAFNSFKVFQMIMHLQHISRYTSEIPIPRRRFEDRTRKKKCKSAERERAYSEWTFYQRYPIQIHIWEVFCSLFNFLKHWEISQSWCSAGIFG